MSHYMTYGRIYDKYEKNKSIREPWALITNLGAHLYFEFFFIILCEGVEDVEGEDKSTQCSNFLKHSQTTYFLCNDTGINASHFIQNTCV